MYPHLSGWMDEWTGADQQPGWELLGGSSGERDACPEHHPGGCQSHWSHMSGGAVPPVPTTNRVLPGTWTTVMEPGLDQSQSKPFINWNQRLRTDFTTNGK